MDFGAILERYLARKIIAALVFALTPALWSVSRDAGNGFLLSLVICAFFVALGARLWWDPGASG